MKLLDKSTDIDGFFGALSRSGERVLMLDYDGTLAPFVVERDQAFPYPGVSDAVDALMAGGGCRVVVVSGRAVEDLVPLTGFARMPEVWGSHGWERMSADGTVTRPDPGDSFREGMREAEGWARASGLGKRVERKPSGIAVHTRGMDPGDAEGLVSVARDALVGIAGRHGLELHDFDGGVELRAAGRDKGDAVRSVLSEMGESAVAAYLGDDNTDEDAFMAIKGRGLGVLVRQEYRETAAGLWIVPPDELLWFIGRWSSACGG